MKDAEIATFVKETITPWPAIKQMGYGERYPVSVILNDGTVLPCVVIEASKEQTNLAIRRFKEIQDEKSKGYMTYPRIVESFVTSGNRVNPYDIKSLSPSRFAITSEPEGSIGGETSMGWIEFYATMKDGKEFRFGTSFHTEFFDMPDGYSGADIVMLKPAVRSEKPRMNEIYRERLFFTCYTQMN